MRNIAICLILGSLVVAVILFAIIGSLAVEEPEEGAVEEVDAAATSLLDEMDIVLSDIVEVDRRLSGLYDAIENGNIDYGLLKPRLEELKAQHDRLLS